MNEDQEKKHNESKFSTPNVKELSSPKKQKFALDTYSVFQMPCIKSFSVYAPRELQEHPLGKANRGLEIFKCCSLVWRNETLWPLQKLWLRLGADQINKLDQVAAAVRKVNDLLVLWILSFASSFFHVQGSTKLDSAEWPFGFNSAPQEEGARNLF